jgi:ABC-type transporter Mla subunit MlaD
MLNPLLPKQALSSVMFLVGRFNSALSQGIKLYQKNRDGHKFRKTLNHLSGDLAYFSENFEAWNHTIKTSEEHKQLKKLQEHLDQAKGLVAQAAQLVDETQQELPLQYNH